MDENPAGQPEELLDIAEFGRLDLRTARIESAERHPNAERLLKIQVDLGEGGRRQLIAGIAGAYAPEDLVGRTIIMVANLKPARLRGELSEGMLLAASAGGSISLLTLDRELPPGSKIR
jgi:methionyl-tRNA synthetase